LQHSLRRVAAHRVLPEAQRFSTLDMFPIFQPTGLLWLGDRLACLLACDCGIVQTPDAEKLNAPKFTSRLSNDEIFPIQCL
jgi:hypothetical protein